MKTQMNTEMKPTITNCASRASWRARRAPRSSSTTKARFNIEQKNYDDDVEPVTQADTIANELIVTGLKREFPNDGILAEESVDTKRRLEKSRVWMVDPLDGTNGFIDGNGDFAVQIGLAEDGQCVLGVVYQPLTGVLYRAVRGGGTWIERPQFEPEQATVSDTKNFREMRLAASRSHRSPRMNKVVAAIRLSRKKCSVARSE